SYQELHSHNRATTAGYTEDVIAFARWADTQKLIVVSNFSATETRAFNLQIPRNLISTWALTAGDYPLQDQLGEQKALTLAVRQTHVSVPVRLAPLESLVLTIGQPSH
ncbi:MAG TPA: alpha amylase C-terminal domain-containing protein, partial [Cellvibrio sp.]|nr:alpha amylase C-terminal domain-containing protein [Cellvibrio sp.]